MYDHNPTEYVGMITDYDGTLKGDFNASIKRVMLTELFKGIYCWNFV
jgi:hypothetical protein